MNLSNAIQVKTKKVLETSCYLSTAQPHFSFCSVIPQDLLFLTPGSHSYAVGTVLEGSSTIKLIIRTQAIKNK